MNTTQLRLPIEDTPSPMSDDEVAHLRSDLMASLDDDRAADASSDPKERVRLRHKRHRGDVWRREFAAIGPLLPGLLDDFASGVDVVPEMIEPTIEPVVAGTRGADLFRLATLLWSVPVSRGYGRRMRFLVRDRFDGAMHGRAEGQSRGGPSRGRGGSHRHGSPRSRSPRWARRRRD
jgi:hypothetical protein